jgi:hypothetical protein
VTSSGTDLSLTVRVSVSDQERSRWAEEIEKQLPQAPRGIFAATALLWFVLAVLRAATLPLRPENVAFVIAFFLVSAFNLALFLRRRRRTVAPLHDAPVALDDTGLSIGGARPEMIPWRGVERVVDAGDAFLVIRRGLRHAAIPIPTRDCNDGGAAIWNFLEGRLIGRRSLNRPRRSDPIVNVAAR